MEHSIQDEWKIELTMVADERDEALLQAAIARYAARFPDDRATPLRWTAFIEHRRGNIDREIELLTSAIDEDRDKCSLCRSDRADVYLAQRKFDLALHDFNICLTDTDPIVVERFYPSLNYRKALILALTGNPEFETFIARVPPDYSEYVLGERRVAADLRAIYQDNRAGET